jgi:hypothetical protein
MMKYPHHRLKKKLVQLLTNYAQDVLMGIYVLKKIQDVTESVSLSNSVARNCNTHLSVAQIKILLYTSMLNRHLFRSTETPSRFCCNYVIHGFSTWYSQAPQRSFDIG